MTVVREAHGDDFAAIGSLHVAAIEAFGPEAYDEREVAAWARTDDPPTERDDLTEGYWVVASRNAVGFYERTGYERRGPVTHETSNGVEFDCVAMAKRL
ncbi:MAG: hypothetical protein V5A44_02085 [Haloarculaceae archaeon]